MNSKAYAIIGGDERFFILSEIMANHGETVFLAGFDTHIPSRNENVISADAISAASLAEKIILPFPVTRDGVTVNAPFSGNKIKLSEDLFNVMRYADVFCGGKVSAFANYRHAEDIRLADYSKREDFLLKNAYATAEALLMLAIQNTQSILGESRIMIFGYGRIGRLTAELFSRLGAEIICVTHSADKIKQIAGEGYTAVLLDDASEAVPYADVLINTADALVITEALIKKMNRQAVIIDAASLPGGTDFAAAEKAEIRAMHATGLPGKFSPSTAARIIWKTICSMKKEEHN